MSVGRMHMMAQLREDSPYYSVFDGGLVPVKSPVARQCDLRGSIEDCYELNVAALPEITKIRLAAAIAEQLGGDVVEVRADIEELGLPIRVSQTIGGVAIDARFVV